MIATSGNQYLRPEYLNPLQGVSVELDAKKSPLALLAQTCSSIGADASAKVAGNSPTDKPTKGKISPGVKSPTARPSLPEGELSKLSSFKPYEKDNEDHEDDSTVAPSSKRPASGVRSPHISGANTTRTHSRNSDSSSRHGCRTHESDTTNSSAKSSSPHTIKPLCSPSHSLVSLGDLSVDPLAAYKLNHTLYPSLGLGLDPLTTAGLSALTAKVSSSSISAQHLSNPYIGYAKVKTVSGTEVVVPVCRDPYCAGCQINTHALQVINEACPSGCAQCTQLATHAKALSSLPSSLIPSIPASSLSGLYNTSSLMGANQVCNWIAGDTYCGKRFSSTEELLQHLRSHTGMAETSASLGIASLHHPLLQHAALPRGYPTPPLSPLSAARFHPYAKSPLNHLTHSAASLSAASLSALAPYPLSGYYNPYSLYARSFNATSGLHP